MIIYLFKGELPWTIFNKENSTKEKVKKIRDYMFDFDPNILVEGLPDVFYFIYKNIITLDFYERPPYEHFITLLEKEKTNILKKTKNQKYKFIWTDLIKGIKNLKENHKDLVFEQLQKTFQSLDLDIILQYFENINKENIIY